MKKSLSAVLLALLVIAEAAGAQQGEQPVQPGPEPQASPQQELTPRQQAQILRQDAEIAGAAMKVVQLVDTSKAAEVWEGGSSVAKAIITREAFVNQISSDRETLGARGERTRVAVTRANYAAGGQVPAGNYINVVFATRFANAPQPVRELVSFRLDDDRTWRVSGYSLR